ncbi:MAG: S1 RNA-binding domain-containing protein [Bacilli bacterium]|nr:MAG: S1 RNA-binding domain-containing protein [Bacilli bacterium]
MKDLKKKDVIKVTVTGVQKYGAFVNTEDDNYDGLIHISEISYGYVKKMLMII